MSCDSFVSTPLSLHDQLTIVTGLPKTQSESVLNFVFFLFFVLLFFLFFSVSVKVLPFTPLLSGVFEHRAFYAYFLRIERVVGNA